MGQTELFIAVKERPEFVRELLRIVTEKLIAYLDFCWEEENLPRAEGLRMDRRPRGVAVGGIRTGTSSCPSKSSFAFISTDG